MMINECTMKSGSLTMSSRKPSFLRCNPPRLRSSLSTPQSALPNLRFPYRFDPNCKLLSPRGNLSLSIPAASNPTFSSKNTGLSRGIGIPSLADRKTMFTPPRASKDIPYTFRFSPMTEKPKFWWRFLACIPYLMPLHETWMYAEAGYYLHPFLEELERATLPFIKVTTGLPNWFFLAYFIVAYLLIVRRKEWPHFLRFHVILGMLLETLLQVFGTASRWMPKSYLYGKLGMNFWVIVVFAHLFTVLECIRCAICGMYADVPFASDAAYIQVPYD